MVPQSSKYRSALGEEALMSQLPDAAPIYEELGLSCEQFVELLVRPTVRKAQDGVWEVDVVLTSVAEAFETLVPLPLSHLEFDEDLVAYVEDEVEGLPKNEPLRIVVLLPEQGIETNAGDEAVLRVMMHAYLKARLRRRRAAEHEALRSVVVACFWGFLFMLGCQVVRWLANFPEYPTLTSTISEGMLVLGWVALWNPYDRLLFSWWPAVKQRRLVERIARADFVVRPSPYGWLNSRGFSSKSPKREAR